MRAASFRFDFLGDIVAALLSRKARGLILSAFAAISPFVYRDTGLERVTMGMVLELGYLHFVIRQGEVNLVNSDNILDEHEL